MEHPNVVYRKPMGKYDAMNFGLNFVPSGTEFVAFNDVDTEIQNFDLAVKAILDQNVDLLFARVAVKFGPQASFYSFLDPLRRYFPVAASGELMLMRFDLLKRLMPLKKCKSEDSYLLFKTLEKGGKSSFCEKCYVKTSRTETISQEENYKRRTTGGIYQALSMTKPPPIVKLFFALLPFISPLLILTGKKGYYWSKGILLGYIDYIRGDKSGHWAPEYGSQSQNNHLSHNCQQCQAIVQL